MGLFDKVVIKTEEQKIAEIFEKFGLNINEYDSERIRKENLKNLKQIAEDISGNKLLKVGLALSMASADKQAIIGYLSGVFNQNWIVIRQNELMIRLLTEMAKRK